MLIIYYYNKVIRVLVIIVNIFYVFVGSFLLSGEFLCFILLNFFGVLVKWILYYLYFYRVRNGGLEGYEVYLTLYI